MSSPINATFGRSQVIIYRPSSCYACNRKFPKGSKMIANQRSLRFHPKLAHLCPSCNQLVHQFPEKIGLDKDEVKPGYVAMAVERFFCKDPEELTDLFVESAGREFEDAF